MKRKSGSVLIAEIEAEAVDGGGSVASALRKCLVLGGELGSPELREWASKELNGYPDPDQLPPYRTIPATLKVDGSDMVKIVTGQEISRMQLPEFARDLIQERLVIDSGIGKIEDLLSSTEGREVAYSIPGGADLAAYMTAETDFSTVHRIYKTTHVSELLGIVDAVRVRLVELVAELRAAEVHGEITPDAADQAVSVAVMGGKNRVVVNQLSDRAKVETTSEGLGWKVWTLIAGLASIVGLILAVIVL